MIPPESLGTNKSHSHRSPSHQTRVSDVKGKRKKKWARILFPMTTPPPQHPRQGFHNRKGAGSTCVHAGLTCRWQAVESWWLIAHQTGGTAPSDSVRTPTAFESAPKAARSLACLPRQPQRTQRTQRGGRGPCLSWETISLARAVGGSVGLLSGPFFFFLALTRWVSVGVFSSLFVALAREAARLGFARIQGDPLSARTNGVPS